MFERKQNDRSVALHKMKWFQSGSNKKEGTHQLAKRNSALTILDCPRNLKALFKDKTQVTWNTIS